MRRPSAQLFRLITVLLAVLGVLQGGICPAHAQKKLTEWEKVNFSQQRITADELQHLSLNELKSLRGLVFARYGRVFDEKFIQDYLKTLSWYKPNPKYHVSMLNDTARHNMDAIKEAEYRKHSKIEPGDLKFYRTRQISPDQLRKYSLAELRIMRAEIEAIHGRRFRDEPWLQQFFNERYWYRPRADYKPSVLTAAELNNMRLFASLEKQQRNLRLAPGMMGEYQDKPITESMLQGLGLYELRLLRNEIYARRGRDFKTAWIRDYFSEQPWYSVNSNFSEASLTALEKRNLDVIVRTENRLHRELSTKPLSRDMLKNLPLEDIRKLRNEIYARRGRQFKDPALQRYFESFAWYRPNPSFRETSLSAIEKRNAEMIRAYEKQGESLMRQVAA